MYGENPGLDYQKAQQEKHGDPWHVDHGPSLPKIPNDATAAEMRELVAVHRVAGFVNKHLDDKEVRELLPDDERSFALTVDDWDVTGKQNARGWSCTAYNSNNEEVKFRLASSLDKEEAEMQAAQAIRDRFGVNPEDELMELPDGVVQTLQRLAVSNPTLAIAKYMENRLPADIAAEFSKAVIQSDRGNNDDLLSILSDTLVSFAQHEAVFNVFKWKTPHLSESVEPAFVAFVDANGQGRALTIPLLEYLFSEFQKQGAPEVAPTDADLRNLSDEEVRDLYLKTRALAASGQRPVGVFK